MGNMFEQRKRPQAKDNAPPTDITYNIADTAPQIPNRAIPDSAPSFDLDAAMQARMANTFGDLSAVRNYTPPVREQAPQHTGPYTRPVTHALSDASPSPSVAGPMQAMKESNSANRDYLEDTKVNEGEEGYDTLDPEKWTTITRKSWFLGKAHRFKAKIDRRAYEMDEDELAANPYNPNGVKTLDKIQNSLDTAPEREELESDRDYNGRRNRAAWAKFQHFGKNPLTEAKAATQGLHDQHQQWGMFELDQDVFKTKLKSMTRMVRDHPELQGNIGLLKRFATAQENEELEKTKQKNKKDKPEPKKKLRTPMKRKRTRYDEEEKPMVPYMGTSMSRKYADEESRYEKLFKIKPGERNAYRRRAGFPLYMNAETDSNTEEGRQRREARFPRQDTESGAITDLPFTGNHELGHMLNFLLIKEKNRGIKNHDLREDKNIEDAEYSITADELVDKALKRTMSKKEYKKLVRYKEDSLGDDEEWDDSVQLGENEVWESKGSRYKHKKGQINLKASGLAEKGHTTKYGAYTAGEFFAEAFADVYAHGKKARRTSIELVKIYEEEMKKYKKK